MHWGYDTYIKQPSWFLEVLRIVNNADAEYQARLNRVNRK